MNSIAIQCFRTELKRAAFLVGSWRFFGHGSFLYSLLWFNFISHKARKMILSFHTQANNYMEIPRIPELSDSLIWKSVINRDEALRQHMEMWYKGHVWGAERLHKSPLNRLPSRTAEIDMQLEEIHSLAEYCLFSIEMSCLIVTFPEEVPVMLLTLSVFTDATDCSLFNQIFLKRNIVFFFCFKAEKSLILHNTIMTPD